VKIAAIPVAHTQYRVVFTKKPPLLKGKACQGICDPATKTITVWRNPNATALRSTLFHEWLHAVFYELGWDTLADDHSVIVALEISLMRLRLEVPSL
jgi:hypothetical protein